MEKKREQSFLLHSDALVFLGAGGGVLCSEPLVICSIYIIWNILKVLRPGCQACDVTYASYLFVYLTIYYSLLSLVLKKKALTLRT